MACKVSHLHVHLVPSRRSPANLASNFRALGDEPIESFKSITGVEHAYSFAQIDRDAPIVIEGRLPSQTRRIVADELGSLSWDWRSAGREEQVLGLIEKSASFRSRM
jgi:hypothetical protein